MDTPAVSVCEHQKFHQTQHKPHKLTENRFIFFIISFYGLSSYHLSCFSSLFVFLKNKSNESMKR